MQTHAECITPLWRGRDTHRPWPPAAGQVQVPLWPRPPGRGRCSNQYACIPMPAFPFVDIIRCTRVEYISEHAPPALPIRTSSPSPPAFRRRTPVSGRWRKWAPRSARSAACGARGGRRWRQRATAPVRRSAHRIVHWIVHWLVHWLVHWIVRWIARCSMHCSVHRSVHRNVHRSVQGPFKPSDSPVETRHHAEHAAANHGHHGNPGHAPILGPV